MNWLKRAAKAWSYACGTAFLIIILVGGHVTVDKGVLTWAVEQMLDLFI